MCTLFSARSFDPRNPSGRSAVGTGQNCVWQDGFFTLPPTGLGKPFEEAAVARIWTSFSTGETRFKLWPVSFLYNMWNLIFLRAASLYQCLLAA